jgi:pilus assembly protein Flp/PilA
MTRTDAVSVLGLAQRHSGAWNMTFELRRRVLVRLIREDGGQDLLEYALLAALIAIAAVGAVTEVGTTIKTVFWEAIAAGGPRL